MLVFQVFNSIVFGIFFFPDEDFRAFFLKGEVELESESLKLSSSLVVPSRSCAVDQSVTSVRFIIGRLQLYKTKPDFHSSLRQFLQHVVFRAPNKIFFQ